MNDRQIKLVQESFEDIIPVSEHVVEMFYARLFGMAPEVKPLFSRIENDMAAQGRKLMAGIALIVKGLDGLELVLPTVQSLGVRHMHYGTKTEHYTIVGEALIYALGKGLGDDFTDEVREAWLEAYGLLSEAMIKAANEAGGEA